MLRLSQLKLPADHSREDLLAAIRKKSGGIMPESFRVSKRSLDARRKPALYYIYSIEASFKDEKRILRKKKSGWEKVTERGWQFVCGPLEEPLSERQRPVIIGTGPAGLFAGLILARQGFRPVLFERGDPVDVRHQTVKSFWEDNLLDPESNVQFGEGGAGTFSDGKLNTLVKDKSGRNRFVLEEFVRHGAPEEILYEARPHIGTDILRQVVASIREEIKEKGGDVLFRTRVRDLVLSTDQSGSKKVCGLKADRGSEEIFRPCDNVILAIGHSARDTFFMLRDLGVPMRSKAFAIGVRVEHPAAMINAAQYGQECPDFLPAASYKLTHQCSNGRGVYTFCMCPGGYVVNSSSEPGRLCVNGMSYHGRKGINSNSAVIVTVTPEDFHGSDVLSGLEFQRRYEELAWQAGSGFIPAQLLEDYRMKRPSSSFGDYLPATKGACRLSDLTGCLPPYVRTSILEGIDAFGEKIPGYNRGDTILLGVETRTSSPVRIERDETMQSLIRGLYPCGEGAGYAGGITSAAMDGLRTAEAVAAKIIQKGT